MAITATYEAIMREKEKYDEENNIDISNNPLFATPVKEIKSPPKKSTAKSTKKESVLKPDSSLPDEPKPPLQAASINSNVKDSTEFVKAFTPSVEYHSQRLGLSPNLMLAQIALETGWGKSAPGFNYGGQKVGSDYKGKTQTFNTKEYINGMGMKSITGEKFRAYNSPAEGIKGFFDFFKSYGRYKPVFGISDPYKAADMMQKVGYATDPKYAKKLKEIVKTVEKIRRENNI